MGKFPPKIPNVVAVGRDGTRREVPLWEVLYHLEGFYALEEGTPFRGGVRHDPDDSRWPLVMKIAQAAGYDTQRAEKQIALAREREGQGAKERARATCTQ